MGNRKDGIRTVADLKQRSFIEKETGCWRYRLQVNARGAAEVTLRVDGRKVKLTGRRAALILAGIKLAPGEEAFAALHCAHSDCIRPDHCNHGTRGDRLRSLADRGAFSSPARLAHLARNCLAQRKLDDAQRLEVTLSTAPAAEVAAQHGVSASLVYALRARKRAPALVPSVFAWRGAA